jgi:hypothetical protein
VVFSEEKNKINNCGYFIRKINKNRKKNKAENGTTNEVYQ